MKFIVKSTVAFVLFVASAQSRAANDSATLPILQCSLESSGNPNDQTPISARGNLLLEDAVNRGAYEVTGLGLIPVLGSINFNVTGVVYGYQLSSGEIHLLLQVFLDGKVVKSKIFNIAETLNPLLQVTVADIPVTLQCQPRATSK